MQDDWDEWWRWKVREVCEVGSRSWKTLRMYKCFPGVRVGLYILDSFDAIHDSGVSCDQQVIDFFK